MMGIREERRISDANSRNKPHTEQTTRAIMTSTELHNNPYITLCIIKYIKCISDHRGTDFIDQSLTKYSMWQDFYDSKYTVSLTALKHFNV